MCAYINPVIKVNIERLSFVGSLPELGVRNEKKKVNGN